MYTIKIDYETGDSFGSERVSDEVGFNWTSLAQAKKALSYIKAHYEAYRLANRNRYSAPKDMFKRESIVNEPWFSANHDLYKDSWQYSVAVEDDDGLLVGIQAFWCGYFETLYTAEVIVLDDPEMKVSFL